MNTLAEQYDALYRGSGFGDAPRFYRWIAKLATSTPDPAPRLVVDIGCGAGGALAAFAERGIPAIGIDFSGVALGEARTRLARNRSTQLLRADGTRLPLADESIDTIINLGNLEHFSDLAAGIHEMHRVLTPRGQAWILLPNLFYSGVIWRVLRRGEGPNHHQPIDRFATREEWQAWLEWGGLHVERVIPYHKGKRWKRLLPSAFAWHFLFRCRRGTKHEAPPPPAPLGRTVISPSNQC